MKQNLSQRSCPLVFGLALAVAAGVGLPAPARAQSENRPALVLPESTDLNRVLRRVTEFFAQDPPKWDEGVRMLQDLLEGRILKSEGEDHLNDPFYSVYSEDRRLFIPFARYCQRLVSRLAPEGLEAYRFLCDTAARREFEAAMETLDADRLQRLAEIYFATEAGPDIVMLLADLATLRGEIGRAIYLRSRLLSEYPDLNDEQRRALLVRQAHAYSLLGDAVERDRAFRSLVDGGTNQRFEIAGETVPLAKLPEHPAFRLRTDTDASDSAEVGRPPVSNGFSSLKLQRLWRFSFASPDPYGLRAKKATSVNRGFVFGGRRSWEMPSPKLWRPGLSVTAYDGRDGLRKIAFKDNDKLILTDVLSGKMVAAGAGNDHVRRSTKNQTLRVRLPGTDFGMQRVHVIGRVAYCTVDNRVLAAQRNSTTFPFSNAIVAVDLDSGSVLWRTSDGSGRSQAARRRAGRRIFFQTAPIAYRDYLYAPVRRKRSFCIAKLDAHNGDLLSVVTVHSGGTSLLRVPAVPPVRLGNVLVYQTNAGAVAAFSLPHLELLWLREYETRTKHMRRPARHPVTRRNNWWGVRGVSLKRWKPVAPIVHDGNVIIAPIDSDTLLCLNANTGRPVWVLPRRERRRGSDFREVVGVDGRNVLLVGDRLQCVDLQTGKRKWEVLLDQLPNGPLEGHGVVVAGAVYLPYKGGVYRFRVADGAADGIISFPVPSDGAVTWGVPVHLQVVDAILLAVTESGIAAFTVPDDLIAASRNRLDSARRLTAVGKIDQALIELGRLLKSSPGMRSKVLPMFVRLSGELARKRRIKSGSRAAIAVLDRSGKVLADVGVPEAPRMLLFRIDALDPAKDAREIRRLRERLADLPAAALGVAPGGILVAPRGEK